MSKQEIKPCKFANGTCINCAATEQNDCEGWVCSPKRQWVGLTVTTILNMMPSTIPAEYDGPLMEFARAVETKLKEKNNG